MFIPYNTDLSLRQLPIVTLGVMVSCCGVFLLQSTDILSSDQLVYRPLQWWDLWSVITSSLAHADIYHILFNLIFFFAFTPALEVLIGNSLHFLLTLFLTALAACWSYTIYVELGSFPPIPSLGLSGVVTGMMGLSAYLMPKARIRTLLFWGFPPITLYIPAMGLALFYIGRDALDLLTEGMGQVNIVAHVFGGVAGYFIGLIAFRTRRQEILPELNEEIEESLIRRDLTLEHRPFRRKRVEQEQYERRAKQAFENYKAQLYSLIDKRRYAEVISQLLQRFDEYQASPEVYEEIYQEFRQLPNDRSQNCLARLLCHLYLNRSDYRSAARIAEQQVERNPLFALGSYAEMMVLVKMQIHWQQPQAALHLLIQAAERYPHDHQGVTDLLLEAELWWQGMGERERCIDCFRVLKQRGEPLSQAEKQQILAAWQRLFPHG